MSAMIQIEISHFFGQISRLCRAIIGIKRKATAANWHENLHLSASISPSE